MAASLTICNRLERSKTSRFRVANIDLSSSVRTLRSKVSSELKIAESGIDLIYCGRCLKDEDNLDQYGIKANVMIHAVQPKIVQQPRPASPICKEEVSKVLYALKTAVVHPRHRALVERILGDPQALQNICAATPGLTDDPIACALLQEPDMLLVMANPDNIKKVLAAHPALGHAAMAVAAAVKEEKSKGSVVAPSENYSLDQVSDDEEEAENAGGQPITASQLAAALAAAGGALPTAAASSSSATASTSGGISQSFFQNAIQQATSGTSSNTGQSSSAQDPSAAEIATQSQLQQLRDMGITDEVVARQALQATGGDIQAALEILFEDNMM